MSFYRQSARLLLQITKQSHLENSKKTIHRWVWPTIAEINRRKKKVGQVQNPRNEFLEWNYEAEIFAFGKRLNENFDRKLLKQALIQREYANLKEINDKKEGKDVSKLEDNYEFAKRGEHIISQCIKKEYGKIYNEDIVEAIHKHLTDENMLAHVGKHIGLTDIILTNEYPVEKSTLSNTFKAVICALEKSQNLETAQKFVKDILIVQLNGKTIFDIWDPEKPYEYLKKILNDTDIEPRLCNKSGVNTILANYQVGLYKNKKLLGIGWGETVETAKDTAALDAIYNIYKVRELI